MSLSPAAQNEKKPTSPLRYHSRNAERFKAIMAESPPREMTTMTKSSPLRSNTTLQSEYKIHETDKYASFEIQNEDRGAWRESPVQSPSRDPIKREKSSDLSVPTQNSSSQLAAHKKDNPPIKKTRINRPINTVSAKTASTTHSNVLKREAIDTKSHRKDSFETTKSHSTQRSDSPAEPNPSHKRSSLPRYMLSTKAFEKKVAKEDKNALKPRPGGITKRTTTRLPRYQSTTTINAIEEIRNEMKPGDTYVPMAARIKLYEKGLGNASNRDVSVAPNKYNPNPSSQSSTSSRSSSRGPTPTIGHRQTRDSSGPPSYARQTSSSTIKRREPKKKESSFNEKLNLWRHKENALAQENRGLKRKAHHDQTSSKQKRPSQ
ncbi:hypothetical protein BD560DRAFT_393994 [Blakeslea trispora]|nr:hypothetical protein BD560DRAFT_393994 [Blakeslea trispora]